MSSPAASDDTRPAVPPRSSQRDSSTSHRDSLYRASPQTSPVQPAPPVIDESSGSSVPPAVPAKSVQFQQQQTAPTAQPTHTQQAHNLIAANAGPETVKTKRQELEEGDPHWKWKTGFRAAIIIVGLIGIGCAAYITAAITGDNERAAYSFSYYYYDDYLVPFTLVTFVLSVLWSAVCVIVFFKRRPNSPVHPGAQVGCDLVLWLGFAVTSAFALLGALSIYYSGADDFSSSSGDYTQANNGTWVWTPDTSSSSYSSSTTRSCSSSSYSYSNDFSSCAEKDAFVNAFLHEKEHRYNIVLTITVCQFLALLFHFVLFVWACVDTSRRNKRTVSKDAEKLAADIVMNMIKSGAIIPAAPNQAYFPPIAQQGAPMNAGQMYPQQQFYPQQQQQYYPQQQFHGQHPGQFVAPPHHGKAPVPQPAVASSSNEKGGARYA